MIFASAGHRAPYNRLMRLLDAWAAANPVGLFGQIGEGAYQPRHFRSVATLDSLEMSRVLDQADLIVADTNIELMLAALDRQIPMLVLPRLAIFGEDVGMVQGALAARIASVPGLLLAADEVALIEHMDRFCRDGQSISRPAAPDRSAMVAAILGGLP